MSRQKVMLGLDQSTSGTKIIAVDVEGQIKHKDSIEHKQYYPEPGYVEHDMEEVFSNCESLLKGAIEHLQHDYDIQGLSITNQRETIVFWDKQTGLPLMRALVWQDRRGTDICMTMNAQGHGVLVEEKTGLRIDPYFSASKIKWALENSVNIQKALAEGTLAIGTVDSYLVYRLTSGEIFATDDTNASRTLLYNITDRCWDDELLAAFGVSKDTLPEIRSSNDCYGEVSEDIVGAKLPIAGIIGDSQGALFGQQCYEIGHGKVTYGTGSSILMYTGKEQVSSDKGIVTSVAWSYDDELEYAIEGMINSSGDTLKWVKDNLGLYTEDAEVTEHIEALETNEGVYIVPAFSGLGAPYWDQEARATIVGMTRKSNKSHIIRAAVESMAYQVADLIELMEDEAGTKLKVLNADGGPTKNGFLMQLQADLLDTRIQCSRNQELSAMGAVFLGGLKLGMWASKESLKELKDVETTYLPERQEIHPIWMEEWHKAVERTLK